MTWTPSGRRWTAARRKTRPATTFRPARAAGSRQAADRARAQRPLASAKGGRIERQHDRKAGGLDLGKAAAQRPISAISRLSRLDSVSYALLPGKPQAPDGPPLGREPASGRKAAEVYKALLAAPHATAECER